MITRILLYLILIPFVSCVGTDEAEDPQPAPNNTIEPKVMVSPDALEMVVGGMQHLTAKYFDSTGAEVTDALVSCTSGNNNLVMVDSEGAIIAKAVGQTTITATHNEVSGEALITVVKDSTSLARVVLSKTSLSLEPGATAQLSVSGLNLKGDTLALPNVTWSTEDAAVATIDSTGNVTATGEGMTNVYATASGVASKKTAIVVMGALTGSKTGTFQGQGSYDAKGMATLGYNASEDLILTLSNDFSTDFALGTYIYLANSVSGSDVFNAGLELGEITTNGAKMFSVTSIDENVELDSYKYVVVLCRPARLTFGYAELK